MDPGGSEERGATPCLYKTSLVIYFFCHKIDGKAFIFNDDLCKLTLKTTETQKGFGPVKPEVSWCNTGVSHTGEARHVHTTPWDQDPTQKGRAHLMAFIGRGHTRYLQTLVFSTGKRKE